MSQSTIGLIGLGTMGAALSRNLASRGILTSVFNRTYKRTQELLLEHPDSNIIGFEKVEDFVHSLDLPRKVILMVNAGGAVNNTIELIFPLLDAGDTIIDCGNSNWRDTIKWEEDLKPMGINFIGCGVSGGEEGALLGPSIMPGGDPTAVNSILPILEQIAAKDFNGNPCVTNVGLAGAGHFVKMVHNGIEYAMMQGLAEIYDVLRYNDYSNYEMVSIFENFNDGNLKSFLLEVTVEVLRTKDNLADGYLVDIISDQAGAKGTGKWTVESALELGAPVPNISAALSARMISATGVHFGYRKNERNVERRKLSKTEISELQQVLESVFLTSYIQGLNLISFANINFRWNIDLHEVTRIWQGGCIIRSLMLEDIMYKYFDVSTAHGLEMPNLKLVWQNLGVSTPVISSTLAYIQAITINRDFGKKHPTNLIQAQRDYFGAHTYQRIDRDGTFTGGWKPD